MVRKAVFICSLSFLFIIAENFSRNNASEECGEQNHGITLASKQSKRSIVTASGFH